jgi:hypothetical protein
MGDIVIGHPEAHEKLTAKLFWKRVGESGYNDAGNVRDYVDATTRSLVTRARAADGARHVNDEQVDVNHEAYTFLLDERDPAQEILLKLARQLTDQQQADTEGATATLEDVVQGKWYAIGAYNIVNVAVTASLSGTQEEDVDFELDRENGRLRVIPDAGISDGEDLTVTFDEPGINFEKYESQYAPLFYCDLIIEEHNQYHRMWLRRMSFTGYLNITEFPSQTGEFGTFRAKVTPSGPVTVLKRPEGQTLPSHSEEGVAGESSSSQSLSSSSSGHSSSSSSS